MAIVNIAGNRFVIGLEWRALDSGSAARNTVRDDRFRYVFSSEASGQWAAARVPDEYVAEAPDALCGAAAVAARARNAVVYHEFDNGHAWVCAVRDGLPLPGFELYVDIATGHAALSEAISYVQGGQFFGTTRDAQDSLESLLGGLTPREVKHLRVQKRPAKGLIALAGFLVACTVLTLATVVIVKQKIDAQDAVNAALKAANVQSEAQRQEEMRKLQLRLKDQIDAQRRSLQELQPAVEQLDSWVEVVSQVPNVSAGYLLKSVTCDTGGCRAYWDLAPRTLPGEWTDPAAGTVSETDGIAENRTSELPKPRPVKNVVRAEGSSQAIAGHARAFNGVAGLSVMVGPLQPVYVVPPAELKDAPKVEIAKRGTVQVTARLEQLREFLSPLDEHVQLTKLTLGIREGSRGQIQLEGAYVALGK